MSFSPTVTTPARTWPGGSPGSIVPLGSSLNKAMLPFKFRCSARNSLARCVRFGFSPWSRLQVTSGGFVVLVVLRISASPSSRYAEFRVRADRSGCRLSLAGGGAARCRKLSLANRQLRQPI